MSTNLMNTFQGPMKGRKDEPYASYQHRNLSNLIHDSILCVDQN